MISVWPKWLSLKLKAELIGSLNELFFVVLKGHLVAWPPNDSLDVRKGFKHERMSIFGVLYCFQILNLSQSERDMFYLFEVISKRLFFCILL